MTARLPRAILAVDRGTATVSVAVLARPTRRWRLLGFLAGPAGVPADTLATVLAGRIIAADPALADTVGLSTGSLSELPRLEARSRPPGTIAVLAASRRAAAVLAASAVRTPWRVVTASPETHDPREMTDVALDPNVGAIVVGAGDPAGPDERGALDDLAALATAVGRRRPDVDLIVVGAVRGRRAVAGLRAREGDGRLFEVGPPSRRADAPDPVRKALLELADGPGDARSASPRALGSLAEALDRRIMLVEIGATGGLLAWAAPAADRGPATVRSVVSAAGALVPVDPDADDVDAVLAWTTGSLDRHRLADRLRELHGRPWADLSVDGVRLRLAAARAALQRMVALMPVGPAAGPVDLLLLSGGAFAVGPAAAVALAALDVVRTPGTLALAVDATRLLGPLGTIEDDAERRAIVTDLVDDLAVPLGSAIIAGTSRIAGDGTAGPRSALGRLELRGGHRDVGLDLVPGDVSIIDLPPGRRAVATLTTDAGLGFLRRARRATLPVTGGLAGLIVDLRSVPLRLPERRDRRRAALAAWEAIAWPPVDR